MSRRVVLIEPMPGEYGFNYLPHGLLSIAAILRSSGFDVSIHRSLPIPNADIIGISATTAQYVDAIDIARKAIADMIVIGGAHVTTATADAMNCPMFDCGIVGDGEIAFLRLCLGDDYREIPGVAYRNRDLVILNPNIEFTYKARERALPLPAYELLELGSHVNIWRNREWSWHYGWQRKNRPKYTGWFSSEISLLRSLGVRSVSVTDENFGCWHKNITTTITALNKLDSWSCRSGVRNFLEQQLDKVLFGSRCNHIEINMITASQRLLDEFYDYDVSDIDRIVALCNSIGIDVSFCATIGLPGETIDSMMDTWNWLRGKRARLETMVPLPGTVYYEEPDRFSQFGFEVVGDPHRLSDRILYKMGTITAKDFLQIRDEMMREISCNDVI